MSFEEQSTNWRQVLDNYFKKSFKRVRITNKPSKKYSEVNALMEKRRRLRNKEGFDENVESELSNLEMIIAEKCEDLNRKKVKDNFQGINGSDGELSLLIIM